MVGYAQVQTVTVRVRCFFRNVRVRRILNVTLGLGLESDVELELGSCN